MRCHMKNNFARLGLLIWFLLCLFTSPVQAAMPKGIYIMQSTMEDTKTITYLIDRAKKVGITTIVVDLDLPSKKYQQNVAMLKNNNITYIARIIMYPDCGTTEQIASDSYL